MHLPQLFKVAQCRVHVPVFTLVGKNNKDSHHLREVEIKPDVKHGALVEVLLKKPEQSAIKLLANGNSNLERNITESKLNNAN